MHEFSSFKLDFGYWWTSRKILTHPLIQFTEEPLFQKPALFYNDIKLPNNRGGSSVRTTI